MIVALLNQPHGVGKTTLALHFAGLWSYRTRHITVIDADPQGRTLGWSEMRAQERLPRRFTVIGLTRNTLHRAAPNIARDVDRVIVDGPCHIAALTRSALPTVDLVRVPVQLPPFVRAAFAETLRLVNEANTFRPQLRPRIVLNHGDVHAVDAREIARAPANSDPPELTSCIGQRAVLADAVLTGRLAFEMAHSIAAARKITALAAGVERMARWRPAISRERPWRTAVKLILRYIKPAPMPQLTLRTPNDALADRLPTRCRRFAAGSRSARSSARSLPLRHVRPLDKLTHHRCRRVQHDRPHPCRRSVVQEAH